MVCWKAVTSMEKGKARKGCGAVMLGMVMIENSEWGGGTEEVMKKPLGGEAHPFMPRDQTSAWPTVTSRSIFGEQMAIYL